MAMMIHDARAPEETDSFDPCAKPKPRETIMIARLGSQVQ
jgi:hypothetical protein